MKTCKCREYGPRSLPKRLQPLQTNFIFFSKLQQASLLLADRE